MNNPFLPFRLLWRALFFLNAVAVFIILYPFFFLLLMREEWFPYAFKLKVLWAKLMVFNTGIRHEIIYEEELEDGPFVYCFNHTSYLDIILAYLVIPHYFHFLGKVELRSWPLFRIFFRKMNIYVNRNSLRGSMRAYQRAKADVEKGVSISIFPEGTVPETAPQMKEFKNGAFKLAIEKQIPIVPITFINNWNILPYGPNAIKGGYPGTAVTVVHKAISTEGMTFEDVPELKEEVFRTIESALVDNGYLAGEIATEES